MSSKENFANTINNLDKGMPKTGNECFIYGSTWGCDKDCPVFQRKKCELQEENEKLFKEVEDE